MKRLCFILLSLLLLLTACYTPAMEVTPKPTLPADTPQVVSPTPLPTPEPTPASTPFPSYEEYFSQRIYYGSEMDDDGLFERHLSHNKEDISPGVALAQELVAKDPLGMIPKTLEWVADRCLYAFWAGGEEDLIFYRLYAPSRTLECLYTVPEEDLENYFYTPQTEIVADWLGGQVGMKICLIRNVSLYSNYEYLWWVHNKNFWSTLTVWQLTRRHTLKSFQEQSGPVWMEIFMMLFTVSKGPAVAITHLLSISTRTPASRLPERKGFTHTTVRGGSCKKRQKEGSFILPFVGLIDREAIFCPQNTGRAFLRSPYSLYFLFTSTRTAKKLPVLHPQGKPRRFTSAASLGWMAG